MFKIRISQSIAKLYYLKFHFKQELCGEKHPDTTCPFKKNNKKTKKLVTSII